MSAIRPYSMLKIAVSAGVPSPKLAEVLTQQREQEPETPISLSQIPHTELIAGLRHGRYDVGMTLTDVADPYLSRLSLWRETIALAVPLRSPLLAQVSLTVDALVTYPLLYCYPEACPSLEHRVAVLSKGRPPGIQHVVSFESMAMLVAAGYGLGIAAQSRITRAQAWEIRMRPFADGPYELRTHLLRPVGKCHPAAERFSRRAAQIAAIE